MKARSLLLFGLLLIGTILAGIACSREGDSGPAPGPVIEEADSTSDSNSQNTTPDSGPVKLADQIFHLTNPYLTPRVFSETATISTLDNQNWKVRLSSNLSLSKTMFGGDKELKNEIELRVWLSNPGVEWYVARSFIRYDFVIKGTQESPLGVDRAGITGVESKVSGEEPFPLGSYLFAIDRTAQQQEFEHIAQQILEATLQSP